VPLCCISRDRLSSGGSGEGMAVGRQLVPLIPVDVGREHHSAIGDQLVQDDLCPVLGLPEPLSELLGVEHASDRRSASRTLVIGTPAMVVFESICMPGTQKRSHPSSNISRTS
jgi:hypothetical protein